jgi:hypothetical protein
MNEAAMENSSMDSSLEGAIYEKRTAV